jgi:uncharacterized membrane protein
MDDNLTRKERAADIVSEFGGSWTFILSFMCFCISWVVFNCISYSFDAYPFILLNLILSCISVFQAPFILMSQNRQADKDRIRAESDFNVDVLAELEIKELHVKMDELLILLKENKGVY